MKPTKFKEYNIVFARNQDQYNSLPAHLVDEPEARVISCWKLSFLERLKILFTGKLWLCLMTFNRPLQPTFLTVDKDDLFNQKKDDQ